MERVIIAFQARDGEDVALFILYAREFCTESRISIEYIESVKYFHCRNTGLISYLRTRLYQEIVMGYLKYAGNLG